LAHGGGYGIAAYTPVLTNMSGTRGALIDLDVDDFEVSDILEAYLTDPKTRPIYNDISTA